MNTETVLQPLQLLREKAESLLSLADNEEWFNLEEQMNDYVQALTLLEDNAYLQSLIAAGLAMNAQSLILQIQELNEKLDGLATDSQRKIASELRQIIQSGKALGAYGH